MKVYETPAIEFNRFEASMDALTASSMNGYDNKGFDITWGL